MSRLSRPVLALLMFFALLGPALACAPLNATAQADSATAEEIRHTTGRYDNALRQADVAALEQFWAEEYTFVNPRGELLTKAERLANLRAGQTTFDTLAPQAREERIRVYGDVAVHANRLTIGGRYSGQAHSGIYRSLVIWVRRDGRWQQVASQLTAVADQQ
jgi:ketosteroid isomerase-like protein